MILQSKRRATQLTLLDCALDKGISYVARDTNTPWSMTDDTALSVGSAETRTRVTTFLVDASLMTWTFTVTNTLWSTIGWRANEIREARARWRVSMDLTLSIWPTG